MIIIIIGLCVLGILETWVFHRDHYPEDLLLLVASFGLAAFFTVLCLHGVGV